MNVCLIVLWSGKHGIFRNLIGLSFSNCNSTPTELVGKQIFCMVFQNQNYSSERFRALISSQMPFDTGT